MEKVRSTVYSEYAMPCGMLHLVLSLYSNVPLVDCLLSAEAATLNHIY